MKQTLLDIAEILDAYRVFPKAFMCVLGYIVIKILIWFTGLENPTTQQAGFASAVFTFSGVVLGWYFNTGRKWDK